MNNTFLIDSHCHLEDELIFKKIDEIILNAKRNNVGCLVCIGTDIETSLKAVEIANCFNDVYAVVGIYPEYAKTEIKKINELINIAKNKKVIGIGEIGFDFHKQEKGENLLIQKQLFEAQIDIANSLKLPIVIHSRDAYQETIEVLKRKPPIKCGVFHCFSYSYECFQEINKLGFIVGFDGPITFKNANSLRETVSKIPLESIILETDSPYLTPEPFRGKINEPGNLIYIAKKLAEIKNVPLTQIIAKTTENFKRVFFNGKK